MPNSKFFIGSYSGDVASRGANYTSCDWSSTVSASYQPVQTASSPCTYTTTPTNPYTYAPQPEAVSSTYYAPSPVISPCDCVDEPVVPECPQEPVYPECPTVPTPPCPTEPFEPSYPDCNCHDEPAPDPCAPEIPAEALPFANRRPRRRNRLNMQQNAGCSASEGETTCGRQQQEEPDPCVRPMPKRKHRGCNHCMPEATPSYASATQTGKTGCAGRCIDIPDEEACPKKKRDKCFLYEKLKQYRRKGKTLCDFLNDYDEETFYAFIQE